jgi:formylglycine-generating enzyme required for sulfatase activity
MQTSHRFTVRQRTVGGLIGMAVLLFALMYHFFPDVLHISPQARVPATPVPQSTRSSPMGFEPRPRHETSEMDAGPPVALAPRAVLERREQQRIATALAAAASTGTTTRPASPEVVDILDRADQAFAAGRLAGGSDSAAALYAQALRTKSDSKRAANGLARVHVQLVMDVEQHLDDNELDAAASGLKLLKSLPGTQADVKRLDKELQSLRKVRPMLAQAARLMREGKALKPAGSDDNALALYRQVLAIDAGNPVAEQGIAQIQRKVLDRALGAVASDDFDAADAALAQASQILPGSKALQDTRGRIEGIRQHRAASVLSQAQTALDSGNLKLARQLRDKALAISPDVQGLDAFNHRISNAELYGGFHPGMVFSDSFVDLNGRGPAMVVIPTGHFMMGSPSSERGHQAEEAPQHEVRIATGFAIARSDITVGQFREFVHDSGYVPDSVRLDGSSVYDGRSGVMRHDSQATWVDDYAGHPAKDTLPVVNVSWNDARAYAAWLSRHTGKHYQLPSEAQFAYALRAGTTTRYWWGDGTPTRTVENLTGSGDVSPTGRRWTHAFKGYRDGYWGPAPIQSFLPNPFGLYDMDGNVSEWVRDCWHGNYTRAPSGDSAWINPGCSDRVLRGGSWGSAPEQVRSAWRQGAPAATRSGRVGFRVVREL